ncbi:MAG: alpha-glucosidase C-terminal domain-containing protein, partial [Lactobacillus sp.]|nr:alpha-glucosidase C-terminal domain-containing protein [Lactobacillus sp.]
LFEDVGYYLLPTSNDSYVYERNLEGKKALVAVSLSKNPIELEVGADFKQERLAAGDYQLKDGKLTLAPYAGVVLEKIGE